MKPEQNQTPLATRVHDWLADPMPSGPEEAITRSGVFLDALQDELKNNPGSGGIWGPLIARVRKMQNRIRSLERVHWVPVREGRLAIGHRPGNRFMSDIALQGGTHILTLLSESEGARRVEKLASQENMNWIWYSMDSADPPDEEQLPRLESLFDEITGILGSHGSIYLHCSAGIHRTGMITHAFLRFSGLTRREAEIKLEELRPHTRMEVGADRLAWGDRFG